MESDSAVNEILTTLYSAPTAPELWPKFMSQLGALTGIKEAALIAHHFAKNDHRSVATLGDRVREGILLYDDYYWRLDEYWQRFPKRGIDKKIVPGEELWPNTALFKSPYYNEFLKKIDVCKMVCLAVATTPGTLEVLSLYRGMHEEPFSSKQLAILEMLMPHLQTSLYTRRKLLSLEEQVSDMEAALDALATALVLMDSAGRCVLVNRAARAILDQRDGLLLRQSRLTAASVGETARLRDAIVKTIAAGTGREVHSGTALAISRSRKRPLHLVVAPFLSEKTAAPRRAVAILFISDPEDRPAVASEVLQLLFGLTASESRLALRLLDGKSLSEAAELNRVGLETVRSQIKSVFQKTGTRRQGELMQLLSSLPNPGWMKDKGVRAANEI